MVCMILHIVYFAFTTSPPLYDCQVRKCIAVAAAHLIIPGFTGKASARSDVDDAIIKHHVIAPKRFGRSDRYGLMLHVMFV
jgi:hypothetical protein